MSMGTSSSKSKPSLYHPTQIMLPSQQRSLDIYTPGLLEGAMRGGYSDLEGQRIKTRLNEGVNLGSEGAMQGLREQYGKAGLQGGVMKNDINDIMEAKIGGYGQAAKDYESLNRDEDAARKQRLMQYALWQPPFGIGNGSASSGFNFSI